MATMILPVRPCAQEASTVEASVGSGQRPSTLPGRSEVGKTTRLKEDFLEKPGTDQRQILDTVIGSVAYRKQSPAKFFHIGFRWAGSSRRSNKVESSTGQHLSQQYCISNGSRTPPGVRTEPPSLPCDAAVFATTNRHTAFAVSLARFCGKHLFG